MPAKTPSSRPSSSAQHVIERLTLAINAYWELTFARQNLDIQTEAVRLAQQQFESNRRQADLGVLASVDVVAAQTQVANFQQTAGAVDGGSWLLALVPVMFT